MDYAENYERCMLEETSWFQRQFIALLARKAQALGQRSHKIWSLKYVVDRYCAGQDRLRVMDCGAWNGWFLSYDVPAIRQRIALDFDAHYGPQLREQGIDFVLADMEKGRFPIADASIDVLGMTSTLEHLSDPLHIAGEIRRVLSPGGVVFITVPDIAVYKWRFWNDVTHKQPFTIKSLGFLFESHGMKTLELRRYNHNFFIAGHLFPEGIHQRLISLRADALLYIGRKPAG